MAPRAAAHMFAYPLMAVGAVVCGIALAGALGGWGESRTPAAAAAPASIPVSTASASSAPATSAPASSGSSAAPSSSPAGRPSAAKFLADLGAAFTSKDVGFLVGRLNPAVVTRYGASQCRTHVAKSPGTAFAVKKVRATAPYDWRTDGLSTVVPDTTAVVVDYTTGGTTSTNQTVHITLVAGKFTWFTDCGTPVR